MTYLFEKLKKITMRLWGKFKSSLNCHNFRCAQERDVIFGDRYGFQGQLNWQWHLYLTLVDLRCHGNKIWDKIGYNSACVRDFCEIFAPIGGFSGMGHQMLPIAFFPVQPPLPWQRNLGQNCKDAKCIALSKITQMIFAVLEDRYHHIVLTHSCIVVSFFTYTLKASCQETKCSYQAYPPMYHNWNMAVTL